MPRKNLRKVGGRTLLERAIAACRDASGIDRVFVSTDDTDIQRAAQAAGAEAPILRPAQLAGDLAPTVPVLQHAVNTVEADGTRIAIVVLVEPTSPFRSASDVSAAFARFRQGDCRSVATVTALERKPENIFVKDRFLRRYVEAPRERFGRRQEMAHLCRINSAVYVVGRNDLMNGQLLPEPIGYVEMDATSSLNIDTPLDLDFADFLAARDAR